MIDIPPRDFIPRYLLGLLGMVLLIVGVAWMIDGELDQNTTEFMLGFLQVGVGAVIVSFVSTR